MSTVTVWMACRPKRCNASPAAKPPAKKPRSGSNRRVLQEVVAAATAEVQSQGPHVTEESRWRDHPANPVKRAVPQYQGSSSCIQNPRREARPLQKKTLCRNMTASMFHELAFSRGKQKRQRHQCLKELAGQEEKARAVAEAKDGKQQPPVFYFASEPRGSH